MSQVPQKFIDACNEVVKSGAWPIYLYGPPGRGKSYGMAALYVRWKGRAPLWHDVSILLRSIMQCRTSEDGSVYELRPDGQSVRMYESSFLNRIRDAGLACFDDIALREPTSSQYEAMYAIVNLRKEKPTIYTSNIGPPELSKVYDGRIADRVLAGTWIEMGGGSKRLAKVRAIKID